MKKRVFVFREVNETSSRPYLHAFPEDKIHFAKSQWGSQNCYLIVNGIEVHGSFDKFVELLGERVDIE